MFKTLFLLLSLVSVTLANAKEINMLVGTSLAPYIFKGEEKGIEYDIVNESLNLKGLDLKVKFVPFVRITNVLNSSEFDGALTHSVEKANDSIYLSQSHVQYENVVISLKSKNLKISNFNDLSGLRVIGFQTARKILDSNLEQVIPSMKSYRELANQLSQVKQLFYGRCDAIIIDRRIFLYLRSKLDEKFQSVLYDTHELFIPTKYYVAFKDEKLRDEFNAGLKQLIENDGIKKIEMRYR